jgi:hypothetical protein
MNTKALFIHAPNILWIIIAIIGLVIKQQNLVAGSLAFGFAYCIIACFIYYLSRVYRNKSTKDKATNIVMYPFLVFILIDIVTAMFFMNHN